MSNEREVFSFDLDESLYFEEGQEVAEMMGVSLDPEISIQPFNDYISIRGVIELHGTYQKQASEEWEERNQDSSEFEDYHSRRYIERVTELESGLSEFVHRFPVEISVPTYRVNNLDEVTVNIESFDYEIPAHNQLKLNSTIEIHGISDNREEVPSVEAAEEELLHSGESKFDFDIKSQEEEDSPESRPEPDYSPVVSLEPDDGQEEEKNRWKYKESQTLAEFFHKESPDVESSAGDDFYESASSAYADSPESRSEEVKDAGYLADMFRTDEEERYARMKLCIVQEKDTVESIAERYEISPLQLVKQNRLSDESIEEGQLLYIPYRRKK